LVNKKKSFIGAKLSFPAATVPLGGQFHNVHGQIFIQKVLYMGKYSSKNAVHGQIFIQKVLYMGKYSSKNAVHGHIFIQKCCTWANLHPKNSVHGHFTAAVGHALTLEE
jgi:hypothetical protein